MIDPYDLETGPSARPYCLAVLATWTEYMRHREGHEEGRA